MLGQGQNALRLIVGYNGKLFYVFNTPSFSGHLVATFLLQLVNLVGIGEIG